MNWSEEQVPCANKGCDKTVMQNGSMNDKKEWVPDPENFCCCSPQCHEAHEEQIKKIFQSP